MSTLTARLAANKAQNTIAPVMWTPEGAKFQEDMCVMGQNTLGKNFKGSEAHKNIGSLVTKINNNELTVAAATAIYVSLLNK